jgi:hypothetical protein
MQRYTSDVSGPFAPAPNFPGAFTQTLTSNSVRVVLNYKFDGVVLNYKFDGMDFGGR